MKSLLPLLRREARVMFSKRSQPIWFRVMKWMVLLLLAWNFWRASWFWWCGAGTVVIAIIVHFLYRWKTAAWTRAWGGWNDLEAAK